MCTKVIEATVRHRTAHRSANAGSNMQARESASRRARPFAEEGLTGSSEILRRILVGLKSLTCMASAFVSQGLCQTSFLRPGCVSEGRVGHAKWAWPTAKFWGRDRNTYGEDADRQLPGWDLAENGGNVAMAVRTDVVCPLMATLITPSAMT